MRNTHWGYMKDEGKYHVVSMKSIKLRDEPVLRDPQLLKVLSHPLLEGAANNGSA